MVVTNACIHEYTKNHCIVHFQWVDYMVCELALKTVLKKKKNSTCMINSFISFDNFCLPSESQD